MLIAGAVGCGAAPTAPAAQTTTTEALHLVGVNVQGAASLGLGESSRYRLWGSYSPSGIEEVIPEWTSLTPTLLTIDKGVATGLAPGTAKIQATYGAFVATKDVQVLTTPPTPPANLAIDGFCASLYIIGQSCALGFKNENADFAEFAVWESSNPLVASVSGDFVKPLSAGSVDIKGTYLGVSAVLRVTVHAPVGMTVYAPFETIYVGQAVALRATATFDDGAAKVVTDEANWSASEHLAMTTVLVSSPAMSGVSAGLGQVVATYGAAVGSLRVTVIPTAVDTLAISPPTTDPWGGTLQAGGSGTFSVTVNYVIASAPTATVSLYVRDQNGVDLSRDPFTLPRSVELSAGQGFRSLFVNFKIPPGTTMLCPSVEMWAGRQTIATAACRAVGG
jgi:hypothetical protein